LHGHFVTGHIDGTGTIEVFEKRGADWYLQVKAAEDLLRYVVFKGSIAIDGISLTVAEVTRDTFSVWIIPHTYQVTALRERSAGQRVNLEADLLAKYVEKITPRT
jgi:riboflavin synthase